MRVVRDGAMVRPRCSRMPPSMTVPAPAALVVAHPGHELRLFRWLELAHPTVFVLTDGSGRSGRSRIESTRAVLATAGATAGSIIGPLTDVDVYRAMLDGDVARIARLTRALADALARGGFRSVVSDAVEHYNPTHDLCWVMANLAARSIDRYAYAVVAHPGEGTTIALNDDAFRRKMDVASRYADLAPDIDELVGRVGADALRSEVFTPVDPNAPLPEPRELPYFERRGEEQVAAGKYATVLRYREHFVPFVRALTDAVG